MSEEQLTHREVVEKIKTILEESKASLSVARDLALKVGTEELAKEASQEILALGTAAIESAKLLAAPHKLELHFMKHTLRYREDITGEEVTEGEQVKLEDVKFVSDQRWNSSDCGDEYENKFEDGM